MASSPVEYLTYYEHKRWFTILGNIRNEVRHNNNKNV